MRKGVQTKGWYAVQKGRKYIQVKKRVNVLRLMKYLK